MGFAGVSSRTTRRAGLLAVFALLLLTILLVGEGSARAASGLDLGKAVSTATAPVTKAAAPVTQPVAKVTATPAASAPAASAPAAPTSSAPASPAPAAPAKTAAAPVAQTVTKAAAPTTPTASSAPASSAPAASASKAAARSDPDGRQGDGSGNRRGAVQAQLAGDAGGSDDEFLEQFDPGGLDLGLEAGRPSDPDRR